MLLQFTLPNVRTIFILMIAVVASAMQTCAAKPGFVLTLKGHSDRALHINSHGKVTAEHISLAQSFTMDSVGDVLSMDFMDFKITIYARDVNYFLCFHQGRLVGKRNATKDCHFKESMVNGHHQYTHAYNPVLHVGFKRNFRPVGPRDLAKPRIMAKATFYFYRLNADDLPKLMNHRKKHAESSSTSIVTTKTTSTTSTTTPPPSTTTKTPITTVTTPTTPTSTMSPVAGTKRTRPRSRRPTSINSDSIPRNPKSYNQANSNKNDADDDQEEERILQRNQEQHRQQQQQRRQRQQGRRQRPHGRRTVGLMPKPQPKNLEVRHHHNNATVMERRRRRRLERQQHKLQRELWEREQREAGDIEREREREEHHLPKAASSSASSSSSSSTATSTALTATAASLAPSAFNLVAIMAASRRKRDRRKRSAEAGAAAAAPSGSKSQPAADMQLVELPSQRQPQNTEYSKPYVNSNLKNNPLKLKSSNSINVNHAIPALPKNYNYLYSNEHYNLNTKSSTTDSSSLDTSTKFDSPNSHSHSHSHSHSDSHSDSHSNSHSHSAFNQNIDNNLKQLNDRIEEMETESKSEEGEMEMETEEYSSETASEDAVVENRNHIDANNIIDDPNDEEHEELILNKLFRGLQQLQQQQQPQQPNIDNHNENINVVNNNQNHNDNGLLTNNNHNSNYNEQFANDDETIRIQNNKYETHIVQYKHVVFISKNRREGFLKLLKFLNVWNNFGTKKKFIWLPVTFLSDWI